MLLRVGRKSVECSWFRYVFKLKLGVSVGIKYNNIGRGDVL